MHAKLHLCFANIAIKWVCLQATITLVPMSSVLPERALEIISTAHEISEWNIVNVTNRWIGILRV